MNGQVRIHLVTLLFVSLLTSFSFDSAAKGPGMGGSGGGPKRTDSYTFKIEICPPESDGKNCRSETYNVLMNGMPCETIPMGDGSNICPQQNPAPKPLWLKKFLESLRNGDVQPAPNVYDPSGA